MLHLNLGRAKIAPLALILALAGAAPVSGAAPAPVSDAPARLVATDDGQILLTPSGMTLYVNSGDNVASGRSGCTGNVTRDMVDPTSGLGRYYLPGHKFIMSCLDMWKPYVAPADAKAGGDWSVFKNPQGVNQWVYKGSPLYLSVRDKVPGDRFGSTPDLGGGGGGGGQGAGGRGGGGGVFRFAGPSLPPFPPGMRLSRYENAMILSTAEGRPVYTPRTGARVQLACSGCDPKLQPIEAAAVAKLDGDWSVVDASPGMPQYAWKGKPLFSAPPGVPDSEIAKAGFEQVVYRKVAAQPPEIGTHYTLAGEVYTDKAGRTLYTYNCSQPGCDLPGGAAAPLVGICGDGNECMRRMRPYLAAPNARRSGDWSVVDIPQPFFTDGAGQIYPKGVSYVKGWAYRGRPVFTYYQDKQPGDFWGNTVRWFGTASLSAVRVPGRGVID